MNKLIHSLHSRYIRRYGEDPVAVYAALIFIFFLGITIGAHV